MKLLWVLNNTHNAFCLQGSRRKKETGFPPDHLNAVRLALTRNSNGYAMSAGLSMAGKGKGPRNRR